tara:strand:+ start:276 stop:1643 length:1368 start_codon:yes stop_codon:yes gene_type:complete
MCHRCSSDFYRAQQDCDPCNNESSATFALTIGIVVFFIVSLLLLTKYDFKLASLTALVDFMQTIAILGHLPLPWPSSMRWMFKVASVFIFNFQMAAPECYDHAWRYDYLWYCIQLLPLLCVAVLFFCYVVDRCLTNLRDCCRKKTVRVIHVNKITPAALKALKIMRNTKSLQMATGRASGEHLRSVGGAGAVLVLYLYFALLSMAVQVHMCEELDSALSVLIAEPSEPCTVLYSYQEIKQVALDKFYRLEPQFYPVLYPLSILSLVLYGVGIPLFYHWVFWHKHDKITLDLWRRARGRDVEGSTWRRVPAAMKLQKMWRAYKLRHVSGLGAYFVKKNPTKMSYLDVRRVFGKVYEDFSPDHAPWRLCQLWRKIFIAVSAVMFSHSPALSAGLISVILILSFALQMHVKPFMYARHIFSTEHKSDHQVRNANMLAHSKEQRKIINMAKFEAGDPGK